MFLNIYETINAQVTWETATLNKTFEVNCFRDYFMQFFSAIANIFIQHGPLGFIFNSNFGAFI